MQAIPLGMVWCREHQRLERVDDLIDFECSDIFLDYYHRQGFTPRQSSQYFTPDLRIAQMQEEVARLRCQVADLATRRPPPAPMPTRKPKKELTRGVEMEDGREQTESL